jgi:hypothetical protein
MLQFNDLEQAKEYYAKKWHEDLIWMRSQPHNFDDSDLLLGYMKMIVRTEDIRIKNGPIYTLFKSDC